MVFRRIVKLLVVAATLVFSAAQAGADDYGIAKSGHPVNTQGADDYGIAHAPKSATPHGADDYGIA